MLIIQYCIVFSNPKQNKVVQNPKTFFQGLNRTKPVFEDFDSTEKDIINAFSAMSSDSSPGPDASPAMLLKNCKNTLAYSIHNIWRESLNHGVIPGIINLFVY